MTKIATSVPPFCASCFQAGPEKRYIDFDAAYDGPVMTLEDGRKQPIDDLVICENCLSEAFALLDPEGLKGRIADLEGLIKGLEGELAAKDKMIQRLGVTTTELIEHPIQRRPGPQHPAGPIPPEVKTFIAARRKARTSKNISEGMKKAAAERGER